MEIKVENIKGTSGQKENYFTKIVERINLQSIGYYIKEGSYLAKADENSFKEREENAEKELDSYLHSILNEKEIKYLLPEIWKYAKKKEEIHFSLGMKIGAKLALLLTTDFEHDF